MKYLLDDDAYEETKKIALGQVQMGPLLSEFADWFMSIFSVNILNVKFNLVTVAKRKTYRLYVIIENTEDYQKMFLGPYQFNRDLMMPIATEFDSARNFL